jgi:hypothetical protein
VIRLYIHRWRADFATVDDMHVTAGGAIDFVERKQHRQQAGRR